MINKPIVSTINKWIWDSRYCLLLLFIRTRWKYQKYYFTLATIYRRYIPKHGTSKVSKQTGKVSKQEEPPQPTTTISSRKKKFSVYFTSEPYLRIRLNWQTTPFEKWLLDKGCEVTSNPHEADIIVIGRDSYINNPRYQNKKKFLLAVEPYWSQLTKPLHTINGQPLLVSNCHVNSLLTSNYACYPFIPIYAEAPHLLTITKRHFSDIKSNWHRRNKVATMMGYRHPIKSRAFSLLTLRTEIALYGRAAGITDIKGRSWPDAVASKEKINLPKEIEHPRYFRFLEKNTWLRQRFLFNFCFENSNIPYYVTEKLWDAFVGYTLPIYYSNDTIYETFPKGSFIDYRDFKNKAQLYQYILDMPADEYLDRLNLGIEFVSRYEEHAAEFRHWQKTARQHVYDNLLRLHEMK